MATVSPPVFTDFVNQQFFIEAQGGSQPPTNYLDRFPNALYTKAVDSVLVTFLYALLGPVGVGQLRQEYLEARLLFEEAGLSTANLDALYTSPFAFARLAEETYQLDADASLLSAQDRTKVLASDASFRNRAIDFLKGVRAGGTLQGLTLVAKSGLNRPVEIIENYRSLYDLYSDRPLNLPFIGTTTDLNEVIVLPRQTVPHSAQQTLTFTGEPTQGWFTLTLPLGPPYQVTQIGLTNGSNIVTVPNAALIPAGSYVSITGQSSAISAIGSASPVTYAEAGPPLSPTTIQLVYPTTSPSAGQAFPMSVTGTYWAYVANAETLPLPYNATAAAIQAALQSLSVVGGNNISVSGGPLPDQPVTIQYSNKLSDQPVPALLVNLQPNPLRVNGIGPNGSSPPLVSMLLDVTNNSIDIAADVTMDIVGASADSQATTIAPADEHAMQVALDQIRPQTSFITTQLAPGTTQRQPTNNVFSGSNYTEVLRYETGNASVTWPAIDSLHWIENTKEHEAPRPVGDLRFQYQGFHNILNIFAYTEAALNDPAYSSGNLTNPLWVTYWDTMIGQFSPSQVALYPLLASANSSAQYGATQAIAASPDPLVINDTVNGTGVIDGIYPSDYLGLPGVPQLPATSGYWASAERVPDATGDPSIDYLEVDLGTIQAVNYIYFEATNKPYNISVAYDVLDQSPARRFIPVILEPSSVAPSVTSLHYNATVTNPWSVVEIHCANGLGGMIFTRYLRIGFQRNPAGTPFAPLLSPPVPYSIEVRNLRIGRNVAVTTAGGSSTVLAAGQGSFNNLKTTSFGQDLATTLTPSGQLTAQKTATGPTNLLVNPSFESPISPDVSVPVGGWDIYQNDFLNPTAIRPAILARTATWSSVGTESLEIEGTLVTPPKNFNIQPICPTTWVSEGAAKPNGWWPVLPGHRYRWVVDIFGVANANYSADPGGSWIGIDFWNASFDNNFRTEYGTGFITSEQHVQDGSATLGFVCEIVAPPDAVYAIPLIGLFGVTSPPAAHVYVDNAFWGDVTNFVTVPSAAVILADIGRPDAPSIEALMQVLTPDGSSGLVPVVLASGYENFGLFFQAAFSPDGTKIAVLSENGPRFSATQQIFVQDRNGSNAFEVTNLPTGFMANLANTNALTWSPDGTKLAMIYNDVANNAAGICVIHVNSSGSTLIPLGPAGSGTSNTTIWSQLRWSPDGTKFAYETFDSSTSTTSMAYCNADGTGITTIPSPSGTPHPIDWFDNSHLLVWVSGTTPMTFQKIALSGTATVIYSLTGTIQSEMTVALSQDATQIAFADASSNIWVMPSDGSVAPTEVPLNTGGLNFLDWGAAV